MTSEAVPRWAAGRWGMLIALVLVTQLALIFWLGRPRAVPVARTADPAPTLELTRQGAEFDKWKWDNSHDGTSSDSVLAAPRVLALSDPTLLALPHRQGFSGPAWLSYPAQTFDSLLLGEPARWLEPGEGRLGSELKDFMATNQFEALPALEQQELALKLPTFRQAELPPAHSRLWLAGGLAGHRLLASPDLPSWPSAEILTNSVVQLLVAADGVPISATLLKTRVAPNEADDYALREARKLRFEPVHFADPTDPTAGLTWGQLVFEWRTVPVPATNAVGEPK